MHRKTTRSRRPAKFTPPRCEQLEERLALALFNVAAPQTFTGLNNNTSVAVADLNRDGLLDAVLTNFGTDYASGAGTTITALYRTSLGAFNRVNLSTGGQNVNFVSIADIDGDNWPDLVTSNANRQNTGSVSVFRNDGAGNLSLFATPFSTFSYNPNRVLLSDVTGDGILDAVVGSQGKDIGEGFTGNNVNIFQGNVDAQGKGNFTFSSSPITTLAPSVQFIPTAIVVADLDSDGVKDIAAVVPTPALEFGQPEGEGKVYFFRGTGGGSFAAPTQTVSGGPLPVDIKAADVNGDSKPDLVVANAGDPIASPEFNGNSVGVLLNTSSVGNVTFGPTTSLLANCYGTFAVAIADFNMDGKPDIAAVNYGSTIGFSPDAFVSVYMGNGSGAFVAGTPGTYDTMTDVGGGQYLAVGDFDANGSPDLIVAHGSNKVGMLYNTTVVPSVTAAQYIYMTPPQRLTFTFSQNVSASLGLNDVTIVRVGTGTITPAGLSFDTNTNTATVTFSGILADGNYHATLNASGITNADGTQMASNYVLEFFILGGDADHNRVVDVRDLVLLASNWLGTGKTWSQGDFTGDGIVNQQDLTVMAQRWQQNLALPPPASAPVPVSTRPPTRTPTRTPVRTISLVS